MKIRILALAATLSLVCASQLHAQQNYTLQTVESSSENWTALGTGNWIPANGAGGNLTVASVVANNPSNTFEVLAGFRLRTPGNTGTVPTNGGTDVNIFPGVSLKIDGTGQFEDPNIVTGGDVANGELAFKQSIGPNSSGPFGLPYQTNYFPLIILNGGDIDTRAGGVVLMTGNIQVVTNYAFGLYSYIYNDGLLDRDYQIYSTLSGSGGLGIINYAQATGWDPPFVEGVTILGTNNTFTGPWHVFQGPLLGATTNAVTGVGCLGTNTITIDPAGVLETLYDINNPHGDLILSGQMFLHQNDTFHSVVVGTTPLAPGVYTFIGDGSAFDLTKYANTIPLSTGGTASMPAFPTAWNPLNDSTINGYPNNTNIPQGSGVTGTSVAGTGIGAYYQGSSGTASLTVLAQNTTAVTITTNPVNAFVLLGQTATFSVAISGPETSIQWYSNDVIIAGATNLTYTTVPATSGMNGALYKIIVTNPNGSANATASLDIGTLVNAPGYLTDNIWEGPQFTETNIQGTSVQPTATVYYSTFEVGDQGTNYVDQVSGFFIAPITTNYVFFLSSYLNSDLFLSTNTNAANKVHIAQENIDSNTNEWLTSVGGSTVSQKRSDQFSPDGVTMPFSNGIPLTAGTAYYIEADHVQTTGAAHVEVTFKYVNAPDPADGTPSAITSSMLSTEAINGGTLSISSQPSNATTVELHSATFSVGVTAVAQAAEEAVITYQWQKNGVNIAGATGTEYTTPPTQYPADNGAKYDVIISMPGVSPVTSRTATNTVVQDLTPPDLAEAPGAVLNDTNGQYQVGVVFSKPVIPASATNLANYHLSSGTVTAAQLYTNTGLDRSWPAVMLTTTNLAAGHSYTLTVSGVTDTTSSGNVIVTTNVSITTTAFSWAPIGVTSFYADGSGNQTTNPVLPWAAVPVGTNGFDLINAGQFFYLPNQETGGTEDDITFAYIPLTNNFDVVVQIQYVDPAFSLASAGLMVREYIDPPGATTGEAARFQSISVTPTVDYTGTGAPTVVPHIITEGRLYNQNANAGDILDTGPSAPVINEIPQPYPNVWLRMQRTILATNDFITMYHSTNGINWLPSGQQDMEQLGNSSTDIPTNAFVGVFFGASVNTIPFANIQDWAARARNFGNFAPPPPTSVTINSVSASAGQIQFSFNTQVNVTYVVQFSPTLRPANWQMLTTINGNGAPATATDTLGAGPVFYRVMEQPVR
jgi:hypothetical protein